MFDDCCRVSLAGIVMCGYRVVGYARSMGEVADELQHQQAGAEEKPAGCAGCAQLVWPLQQGGQGVQVYDHHQDGRWVPASHSFILSILNISKCSNTNLKMKNA